MEEAEERHQVEIKVYKQKAKQLLYEHHNASAELRMNSKDTVYHIDRAERPRELKHKVFRIGLKICTYTNFGSLIMWSNYSLI